MEFELKLKGPFLVEISSNVFAEYVAHHTHNVYGCIGQHKWNYYKLVVPLPCMKGGFVNILVVNPYLVVPRS